VVVLQPGSAARLTRASLARQSPLRAPRPSLLASFSDQKYLARTSSRSSATAREGSKAVSGNGGDNICRPLVVWLIIAIRTCCSIFCALVSDRSAFISSPRLSSDCVSSFVAFSNDATCCSSSCICRSAATRDGRTNQVGVSQ
jgi:hypothetical protein